MIQIHSSEKEFLALKFYVIWFINREDWQCSYNVTLRCVRLTIVVVEKQ